MKAKRRQKKSTKRTTKTAARMASDHAVRLFMRECKIRAGLPDDGLLPPLLDWIREAREEIERQRLDYALLADDYKELSEDNKRLRVELAAERESWHRMVMEEAAELGLEWRDYKGVAPGDFKAILRALHARVRHLRSFVERTLPLLPRNGLREDIESFMREKRDEGGPND